MAYVVETAILPAQPLPGAPLPARRLTAPEYQELAQVPPAAEWFANIRNPGTRRIYETDLKDFMHFVGIWAAEDLRTATRAHVLAWRTELERRLLGGATIRRKLAALSSLFEYLCNANAIATNPVKGVARPKIEDHQGKTPTLSDAQVRHLLAAPKGHGIKAKRDRAILSVLFFHALRRAELCGLKVRDWVPTQAAATPPVPCVHQPAAGLLLSV